ncbi:dynein regulatory complex subunit 4 isoform X2 [Bacillus rossius redtenbacheri]|uniref:dynein regulatory complex subunit 4 isoform X2 n=1 Tax=Bacillus rossius redtenbacheri TaxID=93214 RepID=UPI002FDD3CD3
MPPKKKGAGAGKGGKKKAEGYMIDGVSTTEMSREQLEVFAHRLREEIDREREERNFFELERDKIHTFWEITREQLDESRAELRNKDREIEESEEKHQAELETLKQKVKLLMYEQQNDIAELKAEGRVTLKLAEDGFKRDEQGLLENKRQLKASLREQQLLFHDQMSELSMRHSEEASEMRAAFALEARTLRDRLERRLAETRGELALRHRLELTQLEEQKNQHICELTRGHERAFSDMKNYYDDITLNNLALNGSLKEQLEKVKQQAERMEQQMHDVLARNKQLAEPLEATRAALADLQRRTANYDQDKASLSNMKIRLNKCYKKLEDLKCENEFLQLRYEKLQAERDELQARSVQAAQELQQKAALRVALLEERLGALAQLLEQKEAQVAEVLAAAQLDPVATAALRHKLDSLLDSKNTVIKELRYELARAHKARDDTLRAVQAKLRQHGIPAEELGLEPQEPAVKGPRLGRGPAGLVTANR